jgi:hypothetical protein
MQYECRGHRVAITSRFPHISLHSRQLEIPVKWPAISRFPVNRRPHADRQLDNVEGGGIESVMRRSD